MGKRVFSWGQRERKKWKKRIKPPDKEEREGGKGFWGREKEREIDSMGVRNDAGMRRRRDRGAEGDGWTDTPPNPPKTYVE